MVEVEEILGEDPSEEKRPQVLRERPGLLDRLELRQVAFKQLLLGELERILVQA